MIQATTTYLQLVNDTIEEAGDDLASFAVDGSDFLTNPNAMMTRFRKWVRKAWRDIQQESLDWEWMSEQGIVTIVPGIMFYSVDPITTLEFDYTTNIYDVDNTITANAVPIERIYDLTGVFTENLNLGYADITANNSTPISFGMKSGGSYFFAPERLTLTLASRTNGLTYGDGTGPLTNDVVNSLTLSYVDGFGTHHSETQIVQGVILSNAGPGDGSQVIARLTGGTGEFFSNTIPPVLNNTDADAITLTMNTSTNSVSCVLFSFAYDVQNYITVLLEPPNNVDQTLATKIVGFMGPNADAGTMTLGMVIDSVVITNAPSGNGTYDNDGSVTLIQPTPGTGNKFFIEFTDPDLIENTPHNDSNYTMTFKHGVTTVGTAEITSHLGTDHWAEVYYPVITGDPGILSVHSWKSFYPSEEIGAEDFQENIREINNKTWRIISRLDPTVAPESPLTFVPWDEWVGRYDLAGSVPAVPRMITEDEAGRFRLYPQPNMPYTLMFTYIREPQVLELFDDIPHGLPAEYIDLIMWRALIYYGLYDEQPSIANVQGTGRAQMMYKNLLMKFEMQTRPKFHFKPKRLY